ncbi:MAG: sialidase family protein [Betaproteobacteria bacterium]
MNLPRPLIALCFAAACGAAVWRAWPPAPAAFVAPNAAQAPRLPAEYAVEMLPIAAPSAHAATLAEFPDGRIAAAWFAGSREGARDVAVWFSIREPSGWTPPRAIVTREGAIDDTRAYVRKLGNPVLLADGPRLHLWFVSAGIGGWAGSSINHTVSTDGGQHWSPATKLATSPFLNIGTLVRTGPLALADGGWGLPVYHEFIAKRGEWLRLDSNGGIVEKVRLPADGPQLQPAVALLDGNRALALLRDAGPAPGRVRAAATTDAGHTWTALPPLPVGNPNSSVALVRLPSGKLLLAGNPAAGRHILELHLSSDEGRTWKKVREVENAVPDGKIEFSYPALYVARDGRIHLAWTWLRRGIRHAVFTEAALEATP